MEQKLLTVSTTDKAFEEIVTGALDKYNEVFVLSRPSSTGGEKHWYVIHDFSELQEIVNKAKRKDAFSVFPTSLLSVRGEANAEQEAKALAHMQEYGEIFFGVFTPGQIELGDYMGADEKEDVEDWFKEHQGAQVFGGRWPDFELEIVGAYVPDEDGVIRPGAY